MGTDVLWPLLRRYRLIISLFLCMPLHTVIMQCPLHTLRKRMREISNNTPPTPWGTTAGHILVIDR